MYHLSRKEGLEQVGGLLWFKIVESFLKELIAIL